MKLSAPVLAASFLLLVAVAAAFPDSNEPVILCESQQDCMGLNTVCENGMCTCPYGLVMVVGDCYVEELFDGALFRRKRSPGSKVEKLEKKLIKAQIKEAKKHGAVVVPVAHVPVAHVPVVHAAPATLVHVSRHRRTPGAVSKLERKIVKAQVKRVARKEGKKALSSRHKRDSHKKIEKLERKLAKEHLKQAKKGHVAYVPVHAPHYSYHPQPVAYHHVQPVHHVKKPKGIVARAKSYLG